jgi:ABC-type antimicrobial peptide transport system permease subunit
LARTTGDSAALAAEVEREFRMLEPELVFLELGPVARMMAASMLPISLGASVFGGLAGLAMLLAGLGVYGVIAFSVSRRTREIGIRMALGSTPGAIVNGVVREAFMLVGLGTVVGVVLAAFGAQALSSILLGVTALDPVSYLVAGALLITVAAIAAAVPARRAAAVDPLVALRSL